eukprot:6024616-Amphidinium_carterae.4
MQGLKNVGRANTGAPAIALDNGRFLAVAPAYAHLGCMFTQDASCSKEVKRMLTKTAVELGLKRPILHPSSIERKDRLMLCSVHILWHHIVAQCGCFCHLSWILMQFQKLNALFMQGVSACDDKDHKVSTAPEVYHITHDDLLREHSFRSYQVFLDRRRLMFFLRLELATVECEVVRSAASLEFGKFSLWPPLFEALRRFSLAVPSLGELPAPSIYTLDIWSAFAILHHQEWVLWVHDYKGSAGPYR